MCSYKCECGSTGFEGRHCESNIDDCARVQCAHNGTCVDGLNAFRCECHAGFVGQYCQVDIDECASSPCHAAHGTCWQNSVPRPPPSPSSRAESLLHRGLLFSSSSSSMSDTTTSTRSTASNANETSDTHLELLLAFHDDDAITTSEKQLDYSRAAGYWCECAPGYTGAHCELDIDECATGPCGHNGLCVDMLADFKCLCHAGYTGRLCEHNINECELYSPCAQHTRCVDIAPDYQSAAAMNQDIPLDGYRCECDELNALTRALRGNEHVLYSGRNCTLRLDACEHRHGECLHGSACRSTMPPQHIVCLCPPGLTGQLCQHSTLVRMDGTYSITMLGNEEERFQLAFDFRLSPLLAHESMPLLYLQTQAASGDDEPLLAEISIHADHLRVLNSQRRVDVKMPFLMSSSSSSNNNDDDDDRWHSLSVAYESATGTLNVTYALSALRLRVNKLVPLALRRRPQQRPPPPPPIVSSYTIGAYYYSTSADDERRLDASGDFLSGACLRDLRVNGKYALVNDSTLTPAPATALVKYGCQPIDNKCSSASSAAAGGGDNNDGETTVCKHATSCVYKWFAHECGECVAPFFGPMCQYGKYISTFSYY